jgi:hypothetical protein
MPKNDGPPTYNCSKLSGFDRDYCVIDRFEACTLEAACPRADGACTAAAQLQLITFVKCVEFDHDTDPTQLEPCATSAGLDGAALSSCAAATSGSDSATEIMSYIYGVGNTSDPKVTGYPDIRINGVVQANYWPDSVTQLEKGICDAYRGPKPSVCA